MAKLKKNKNAGSKAGGIFNKLRKRVQEFTDRNKSSGGPVYLGRPDSLLYSYLISLGRLR